MRLNPPRFVLSACVLEKRVFSDEPPGQNSKGIVLVHDNVRCRIHRFRIPVEVGEEPAVLLHERFMRIAIVGYNYNHRKLVLFKIFGRAVRGFIVPIQKRPHGSKAMLTIQGVILLRPIKL